jgi:hypothetical protein
VQAVWIYTCIVHRFFDERRKDYFVMYVHHIVTIMLVAASLSAGYLRIGLIVLYVHDVSDILVDLLKMLNYLKLEGPRGLFASEIAYVSCVLGWIYWRLYQFPFRVIRGSFLETWQWNAPQPRWGDFFFGFIDTDLPLYLHTNVLLTVLFGLHIYWGHLFLMIGYRILTESIREASRQDYEGDSDVESDHEADSPRGDEEEEQEGSGRKPAVKDGKQPNGKAASRGATPAPAQPATASADGGSVQDAALKAAAPGSGGGKRSGAGSAGGKRK